MPHPTPNGIEWHRSALGKTSEFPKHPMDKIPKKACKTPLAKHTEKTLTKLINIYITSVRLSISLPVASYYTM